MANIADRWADRIGPLNQEEGIVVFHHLSRVTLNAAGLAFQTEIGDSFANREEGGVSEVRYVVCEKSSREYYARTCAYERGHMVSLWYPSIDVKIWDLSSQTLVGRRTFHFRKRRDEVDCPEAVSRFSSFMNTREERTLPVTKEERAGIVAWAAEHVQSLRQRAQKGPKGDGALFGTSP